MVQPFHRPLFVLTGSGELVANLRQVIDRPFALHRVSDWAALKRSLLSASPTAICFADALGGAGRERGLSEELGEVAREFPLLAVVACLPVDCQADVRLLAVLQSWGVAEVLDLERERTASAFAHRLDVVKGLWAQRLFARAFPRSLSARGRALLETVADVAAQGGHVPELANALGIYKRTVPRWCAAAGVPDARRMFAWIRLLLAADLLDDPTRTIEHVARVSGYSSAASLKSTTKQFIGLSPSELRERGAFEAVVSRARDEFREAREALHRSRRNENAWYN
jgi:AraC-like DNA-binding protein